MSKPDTNKLGIHNRYLVRKLEVESLRNWDLFYKRNTTNFFKVCDAVHEHDSLAWTHHTIACSRLTCMLGFFSIISLVRRVLAQKHAPSRKEVIKLVSPLCMSCSKHTLAVTL